MAGTSTTEPCLNCGHNFENHLRRELIKQVEDQTARIKLLEDEIAQRRALENDGVSLQECHKFNFK